MNVLSLFDGMSCGQQALERSGFVVDNYFASEIDKYAIAVTQHNYPNTIQLGSVVDINGYSLPKIDFLCGGSPCQSFSFAGKRKGMSTKCETEILTLDHYLELKSQNFEFEGQSYLFWEYMRLLNEVKPKYFLLENVIMGEKWEKVLSKIKKGNDYANKNAPTNFELAGAICGLSAELNCLSLIATKVARLGVLLHGKEPKNESIHDSILDLANYTFLLSTIIKNK